MNIVFFGSSQFALPSLKSLLEAGYSISCVVTQPDKKKGRGLLLEATEVKKLASDAGLRIYQPAEVNSPEAIKFLKSLEGDLFVVIAYGQILSEGLLAIPKIFAINAHASLLPKYRGAAPINWAIIKGEKTTGVTIIRMSEKMDAGQIILQKAAEIKDEETAVALEDRLSVQAAGLLIDALKSIAENNYKLRPQDEDAVSFAPKLKKEDGLINWNRPVKDIYNLVKGCAGWPGAFSYFRGKLFKLYKVKIAPPSGSPLDRQPGVITGIFKEGISVNTAEGELIIEELQIEGKKKISAADFLSGHKISVGEVLGKKSSCI